MHADLRVFSFNMSTQLTGGSPLLNFLIFPISLPLVIFSARTGIFCVDVMGAITGSKSSTLAHPRQRLWEESLMKSMEYLLYLSSLLES